MAMPLLLAECLSAGANPRLICNQQQRVLWQCPQLAAWLDRSRACKIEREQLVLTDKRAQAALDQFLADPDLPDAAICIEDEAVANRVVIQCKRLQVPRFGPAFSLRFVANIKGRESDFRHFEETFGVTRQEAVICRQLLQGHTVQEIVEAEGKSSDTIRFHIRNLYQKIGVSSREALFANLRPFMFD